MSLDFISKENLKEVLSKGWLTHDAMWFSLSVETFGIEKTNIINRKSAHSMAVIEAKRFSKAINIQKFSNMLELIDFLDKIFTIIVGDFMNGTYKQIGDNKILFETTKCFAFEGVSKIGVISDYECGIFERIEGWFDYFKISYSKKPNDLKCLMHKYGECLKEYTLKFS